MADFMGMMKKAKEMQARMQEMQADLANAEAEGQSGGGLVKMTLNGDGKIKLVKIDPSLMKAGEEEILEDLIMAAHNDAKAKIEAIAAEKTQAMTAGLPIPPGFKLPF